jgi:hypothetical protein
MMLHLLKGPGSRVALLKGDGDNSRTMFRMLLALLRRRQTGLWLGGTDREHPTLEMIETLRGRPSGYA